MVHPDEEAWRRQIKNMKELRQNRKEAARAVGASEIFQMQAIHQRFVNGWPRVAMGSGLGFTDDRLREAEFVPNLPAPAKRKRGVSLSDPAKSRAQAQNIPGDNIEDNDDESERTASVRADYEAEERRENSAAQDQTNGGLVSLRERSDSRELKGWSEQHTEHQALQEPWATDAMFRGRGGGGRGDMLKGATWEYDASIKLESKPTDLFPPHPNLKRPAPLTDKEVRQIKHYKTLQKEIHRGPLYTQPTKRDPDAPAKTFSEDQVNRQYGSNRKADMDPFLGVETYSMRYAPKKNDIPKLSGRPFNKELFPKELWSTLEGEEGEEVRKHVNRAMQKKALILGAMKNDDPSEKTKILLEKIHNIAGDGEDGEGDPDEEFDEEREVDSEFDDDDLGGDYNAETYFDNGEDGSEGEGGGNDEEY